MMTRLSVHGGYLRALMTEQSKIGRFLRTLMIGPRKHGGYLQTLFTVDLNLSHQYVELHQQKKSSAHVVSFQLYGSLLHL